MIPVSVFVALGEMEQPDRANVVERHRLMVEIGLRDIAHWLAVTIETFEKNPDDDGAIDAASMEFSRRLEAMPAAFQMYRAVRDCEGES